MAKELHSVAGFVVVEVDTNARDAAEWRLWIFMSDVDAATFVKQMSARFPMYQYVTRRANQI